MVDVEKQVLLSSLENISKKGLVDKDKLLDKIRNCIFENRITKLEAEPIVNILHPDQQTEIFPLDIAKDLRINKLKEECTNAIHEGFIATNGNTYGFNYHDQMNFTQQRTEILNGSIDDILWKTLNAGVVNHTIAEFEQVLSDAKTHKLTQQQKYWTLEQQILNAITVEDVLNVMW